MKQLSIYTENRRGAAREIFSLFAAAGINVLSLMNSDSGEFGTMRLIVSDTESAAAALKGQGYLCKVDTVLAAELEDQPGALDTFLSYIDNMNVNISYMYVGYMRETKVPVIILHCEALDIVTQRMKTAGYVVY